jgi:hypothetical protein
MNQIQKKQHRPRKKQGPVAATSLAAFLKRPQFGTVVIGEARLQTKTNRRWLSV